MLKSVIIDHEYQSRNLLRKMLVDSCGEVTVVGEAEDVKSGIELLQKVQPDIVFLDIEFPDGDGFDILNVFTAVNFNTIMLTSNNRHAIKAIKYAALDYLLKPVVLDELQHAINKLKKGRSGKFDKSLLLDGHNNKRTQPLRQIVLPGRDSHTIVKIKNIIRIEAMGSYVMIYLENQKSHLVVNSLSYYEELLPSYMFFRIHKSHLINVYTIKSYAPGRSSKLVLKDGLELNIAARRKSAFRQFIKQQGTMYSPPSRDL